LFNTFRNVWYTKVEIDGKSLRSLLTVPFKDISRRQVDAPIIDGVSLFKDTTSAEERTLTINELAEEAIYTAAMPEKCLNGERMGIVLKDYEIIDQTWLLPMLREYIESSSEMNIDEQLEKVTFKVY
jgi:hypothetical protein